MTNNGDDNRQRSEADRSGSAGWYSRWHERVKTLYRRFRVAISRQSDRRWYKRAKICYRRFRVSISGRYDRRWYERAKTFWRAHRYMPWVVVILLILVTVYVQATYSDSPPHWGCHASRYLLGLMVALFVGHVVTKRFHALLLGLAGDSGSTHNEIRLWNGIGERLFYWGSVVLLRPEGIAVYLAYKAVIRWQDKPKDDGKSEKRAIALVSGIRRTRRQQTVDQDRKGANLSGIFAASSVMSVLFGVLGGLISIGRTHLGAE